MWVLGEGRIASYDRVNLKLGAAEYISEEIAPDCEFANACCALLDHVGSYLIGVLDKAGCGWYNCRELNE